MQRPNDKKRHKIIEAAARLFASRPFHEVRLDEVAAAAHVGKGTLYTYFESKDDLYATLIHDGLVQLVMDLRGQAARGQAAGSSLEQIVRHMVSHAFRHPHLFELMRTARHLAHDPRVARTRQELADLIAGVLRRGTRQGVWSDPHPLLTAVFIPSLVRSAMLYGPENLREEVLAGHILRVLRGGLGWKENTP